MRLPLAAGSSLAGLAAVLAGVADAGPSARALAAVVGGVGLALLLGALAGVDALLPPAAVTLGAPVLLALQEHDRGADPVAGVVAGALVVCVLLAGRSLDVAAGLEVTRARLRAEVGATALAGAGAAAAALLVLSVAGTRAPGGTWRLALGLAAALGVVLLLVGVASVGPVVSVGPVAPGPRGSADFRGGGDGNPPNPGGGPKG